MIYWVTTNLWTVGQGLVTRRLVPERQPFRRSAEPDTDASGSRRRAEGRTATRTGARQKTQARLARRPATARAPQRQVRRRKKKGPRSHR